MTFDAVVWAASISLFTAVRYVDSPGGVLNAMLFSIGLAVVFQIVIGSALGIYRPRYRIGSKDESLIVVATTLLAALLLQAVSIAAPGSRIIALSVPIGAGAMAVLAAVGGRVTWRMFHESAMRPDEADPVLVFGAGNAGAQLVTQMLLDPSSPYRPVGLLDDDPGKRDLRISGVRVLGNRTALVDAARRTGASGLIVAVPSGDARVAPRSVQRGASCRP